MNGNTTIPLQHFRGQNVIQRENSHSQLYRREFSRTALCLEPLNTRWGSQLHLLCSPSNASTLNLMSSEALLMNFHYAQRLNWEYFNGRLRRDRACKCSLHIVWSVVKGILQPQNKCCLDERSWSCDFGTGISFLLIFLVLEKFGFVCSILSVLEAAIFVLIAGECGRSN